jgi:hypothetical protein
VQALQAQRRLLAACLGKVAGQAVAVLLALAVQAAQEAVALVVVAVVLHVVHTPLALVA